MANVCSVDTNVVSDGQRMNGEKNIKCANFGVFNPMYIWLYQISLIGIKVNL